MACTEGRCSEEIRVPSVYGGGADPGCSLWEGLGLENGCFLLYKCKAELAGPQNDYESCQDRNQK